MCACHGELDGARSCTSARLGRPSCVRVSRSCDHTYCSYSRSVHGIASRALPLRRVMPKRLAAGDARAILVSKLDEERSAAAEDIDARDAALSHKEMIRATGRAAVEDALMSPAEGSIKRRASEMTAAGLTAAWLAYKEVYGTNGMAAEVPAAPVLLQPAGQPEEIDFTVPVGAAAPAAASTTTTSVSEPQQSATDASAAESSPQDDAAISAALAPDPEVQEAVRDGPRDISFFCP